MPTRVERLSFEALVGALLVLFCLASTAHGQTTTYQVVKAFEAPSIHGLTPYAALVQATDGSFYGTTYGGGAFGLGTVFKIDAAGTLTTLHAFADADGANPFGGVIQGADGNFYGTTFYGGASGLGTIFKMDAVGTLTTIHSFAGGSAGAYPHSGVIQAADGSFYGTTYNSNPGGPGDRGTIFRVDGTGTFATLHVFTGGSDGANPIAGLMQAADGSFYGTTYGGAGTVFKLDASGILTTVHQFTGGSEGTTPYAGVIQGTDGSLYGTTLHGGTSGGGGTVFKLDASGALTTLHSFVYPADVNGAVLYPGVMQAADGSLYGMTSYGDGTIFRLTLSGTLTTLHNFRAGGDGYNAFPVGELIQGTDGRFYGTTSHGGAGDGTVFSLDASGAFATLYQFSEGGGGSDGSSPQAPVIQASDGNLYGTTSKGGARDSGTVFTIDGAGMLTTLHDFAGWEGANPTAGVIEGNNGLLYGTTSTGGSCCVGPPAAGTVFALDAATTTLTTLHTFMGNDDGTFPGGAYPSAVIEGADGRLYGTTEWGGDFDAGTVFSIDGDGTHTLLYSFTGDVDGGYPYAGLIQGSDGRLYGTTVGGGDGQLGTVFAIDAAGMLTTLHSFSGGGEGALPYARVLQGADGSLYGTTRMGGPFDAGTVFKVDAAGVFTTLYAFTGGSDGASPYAGVIQGVDGALYGTTAGGGGDGVGTVFALDATGTLTTVHTFSRTDGATPLAELLQAVDASFYGTTSAGGPDGGGTLFRLTFAGAPLTPVITFEPAPEPTYLQGDFAVAASTTNTDSGALTYSAVSGPCAVVDAGVGIFTATGAGLCTVRASGAATTHFAAAFAQQVITIAKAAATVTLSSLNQTYTGNAVAPAATTVPSGLALIWTNVPQVNVGSYVVSATIDDVNYEGSAGGTFVINPPPSVLSATVLSPNGGEQLVKGVAFLIRWSATGDGVPNPASFDVAFSRNGGAYSNIAGCTSLNGALRSCSWTPSNPSTDVRIRVTARDAAGTAVSDTSNGSFVVNAH